jgi:sigma54-dependent transcription regulator
VRVLAATNRDLQAAVAGGQFREDLYFRLAVVPLRAPALRERADDIPLLCRSFVEQICRENGLKVKTISPEALEILSRRRTCRCAIFGIWSSASTSAPSWTRTAGTSRALRRCWESSAPTCTRRCGPWASAGRIEPSKSRRGQSFLSWYFLY